MTDQQPTCRSQCVDGPRPCPWYSCRYHLGLDVVQTNASSARVVVHIDPDEIDTYEGPTCALDVAEDEATLEEVGSLFGLTRERTRQIEEGALDWLRGHPLALRWEPERREVGCDDPSDWSRDVAAWLEGYSCDKAAAEAVGVSPSTVSRWKRGTVPQPRHIGIVPSCLRAAAADAYAEDYAPHEREAVRKIYLRGQRATRRRIQEVLDDDA